MAAPSSLHTMPSQITITSATIQPSMACGPPSVDMSSGIVMNGPAPIMLVMFSDVAGTSPKRRGRRAGATGEPSGDVMTSPSLFALAAVRSSAQGNTGRHGQYQRREPADLFFNDTPAT